MSYRIVIILKKIYLFLRKKSFSPILFFKSTVTASKKQIKSILFLRYDRIGDMVLSTAVLKSLKRDYPDAKIAVLASERNFDILKHNPNVDEILIYKGIPWFIREIRPRSYDLVIDPFVTYELKQALIAYLSGGKYRIGFEEAGREVFFNVRGPLASPPKRMVDHLLDLTERLGGRKEGSEPEVFLSDTEIHWANEALAEKGITAQEVTIAIHPGAHYPSQQWPAGRFGELSKLILGHGGAKVIILGSKDEESLLEAVKKSAGKDILIFSCDNIRELAAIVSRCDLLVCNNSGPLHIASALKVPTVSMIGPTVTPMWLPYGENDVVINKELSCSPCNRAHCKDHKCLESITVDEVFEAVRSQIAHIRTKRKIKERLLVKGKN